MMIIENKPMMFVSDYHPLSEPLVNPSELSLTEQIIFSLDVKPELVGYGSFNPFKYF